MATNGRKIMVQQSMSDAPFAVETMTNRHSQERQIQINEHYFPNGSETPAYGRKNVNINIIDIPEIFAAVAELYQEETGKKLEV